MAQAILDLFPDAISQFGLIGCALATMLALVAVLSLLASLDA